MTDPVAKKSDLGVRTASAVVMVAVAGTALWLGGWVWMGFVGVLALAVLHEWTRLYLAFTARIGARVLWAFGGAAYVGLAAVMLAKLRSPAFGVQPILGLIVTVMAIDIGAYFAGRTFGGPKIAPRISPSKTWAGLAGAVVGAAAVILLFALAPCLRFAECSTAQAAMVIGPRALLAGAIAAVVAQSGDFFESWMKRRAGVKDSGNLIPGHGGVFDRVDGLLAVCFVLGLLLLWQMAGFLPDGI